MTRRSGAWRRDWAHRHRAVLGLCGGSPNLQWTRPAGGVLPLQPRPQGRTAAGIISPGSAACFMPMRSLDTTRSTDPRATGKCGSRMSHAGRIAGANCSTCSRRQSRRSPKRDCGASSSSMPLRRRSAARASSCDVRNGRPKAFRCSMRSKPGMRSNVGGCRPRAHSARHFNMRCRAGMR